MGGTSVPPYRKSPTESFELDNNPEAVNVSWSQLLDFLKEDRTDNIPYIQDVYMCGGFAETLHNNAEKYGIRAALVGIDFEDHKIGHALDAFVTTDRGLVYIDTTGAPRGAEKPYHFDRAVKMEVGDVLRPYLLFATEWYMLPGDFIVSEVEIYW